MKWKRYTDSHPGGKEGLVGPLRLRTRPEKEGEGRGEEYCNSLRKCAECRMCIKVGRSVLSRGPSCQMGT